MGGRESPFRDSGHSKGMLWTSPLQAEIVLCLSPPRKAKPCY
jgi:hypothetical protein